MTTKKGPLAMFRRLFTADRDLKLAEEEARREQAACRERKDAEQAKARDYSDRTNVIIATIQRDAATQGR